MPFLGGSNGAGSNIIASAYKTVIPSLKNLTASADLTYNPASATTYTLTKNATIARNITLNANTTLQFPNNASLKVIICDTLALNGGSIIVPTPIAGGSGNGVGGVGGNGAGSLLIIARQITGAGTITANGTNGSVGGASASQSFNGSAGSSGNFLGSSQNVGAGMGGSNSGSTSPVSNFISYEGLTRFPAFIQSLILGAFYGANLTYLDNVNFASGAGGQGGSQTAISSAAQGGAGGSSAVAQGATGGMGSSSSGGNGGGGAGAGGHVWIISENAIPAINVQANGGNGGSASNAQGGAGGAGAGGYVGLWAPSSSATISANAGTNGAVGIVPSVNASNGIAEVMTFNP